MKPYHGTTAPGWGGQLPHRSPEVGEQGTGQRHDGQQSPKEPVSLLSERLQAALLGPGDYIFKIYLANEFVSDSFKC